MLELAETDMTNPKIPAGVRYAPAPGSDAGDKDRQNPCVERPRTHVVRHLGALDRFRQRRRPRALMIISGSLAIAGLRGVITGDMQLRNIGVIGYAAVFPPATALLAIRFNRTPQVQSPDLPKGPGRREYGLDPCACGPCRLLEPGPWTGSSKAMLSGCSGGGGRRPRTRQSGALKQALS